MNDRERIFQHWLEDYRGLLYKLSRLYADGEEDREDLLQEILYQVWNSTRSFRGDSKPSTWVYRVALNTALSWRRKENQKPRRASFIRLVEADVPSREPASPEERELLQEVYRCICQLPKLDCALALLYLNGLKYSEMAEVLGMSQENIGVRLSRIKGVLAERMKGTNNGS